MVKCMITARVRNTTGGYVFTGVCLFNFWGSRIPHPADRGVVPHPRSRLGVPHPADGGGWVPHPADGRGWVPHPADGGRVGTPSS